MKIEKINEELVYTKIAKKYVFKLNDKLVRIGTYKLEDSEFDVYEADEEVNEKDLDKLTDDEREVFDNIDLGEMFNLKVGETLEVNEE